MMDPQSQRRPLLVDRESCRISADYCEDQQSQPERRLLLVAGAPSQGPDEMRIRDFGAGMIVTRSVAVAALNSVAGGLLGCWRSGPEAASHPQC